MSIGVDSILNPRSEQSLTVTLDRKSYLREILISLLLSLFLSLLSLAGAYVYKQSDGIDIVGFIVICFTFALIFAAPPLWYAMFRLNAATLARERAVFGAPNQKIHASLKGPPTMGNTMVASSVRSRIVSSFAVNISAALALSIGCYVVTGSAFTFIHVIIGIILIVQAVNIAVLLRD